MSSCCGMSFLLTATEPYHPDIFNLLRFENEVQEVYFIAFIPSFVNDDEACMGSAGG